MKTRVARGGSEGNNDKEPCSSKFDFSKGNFGNIMITWHGVLIQKVNTNLPDICNCCHKIFSAKNVTMGHTNQPAPDISPKVRTCIALDSKSESDKEGGANGNNNPNDNIKHSTTGSEQYADDKHGDAGNKQGGGSDEPCNDDRPSGSEHGC